MQLSTRITDTIPVAEYSTTEQMINAAKERKARAIARAARFANRQSETPINRDCANEGANNRRADGKPKPRFLPAIAINGVTYRLHRNPIGPLRPIDRDFIHVATQPKYATVRDIMLYVASVTGVSANEIKSPRRANSIVYARCLFAGIARRDTKLSWPQIGKMMGNRDHTTAMHAGRKYEKDSKYSGPLYRLPEPDWFTQLKFTDDKCGELVPAQLARIQCVTRGGEIIDRH